MNKIIYAAAMAAAIATAGKAQEFSADAFDAPGFVENLNAVANILAEGELTNADALSLAEIGCRTVRKIAADELFLNAANWIEIEGYPEPALIAQVDMEEFVEFEKEAFTAMEASAAALAILETTLREQEVLPVEPPSFDAELIARSGVEARYCEAQLGDGEEPAAPASEAQVILASSVLDTVTGAAIITVDAVAWAGSRGLARTFARISVRVGQDWIRRGAEE